MSLRGGSCTSGVPPPDPEFLVGKRRHALEPALLRGPVHQPFTDGIAPRYEPLVRAEQRVGTCSQHCQVQRDEIGGRYWARTSDLCLPCETEVGCLRINDMRGVFPIATRTCCHLISLDITQCHERTVPKLSQNAISRDHA